MQTSTQINRTHSINEHYFDKIDTQEKAYWLGFLWADGSISKTAKRASGPNRIRVTQKWDEREHLERFREAISADNEIVPVYHESGHTVAQLDINCRPLCEALQKLGYGPKSIRTHIPKIRKNLMNHFVRGYFDGDGCLSVYVQKTARSDIQRQEWSLTGDKKLMREFKDLLSHEAGTTPTVAMKGYKKSPKTSSLRYGKKADIKLLYDYLYKNASVYLDTKHEKFIQFFSRQASKRIVPRRCMNSGTRTPAS